MTTPLEIRNRIDELCDEFDRDWSGHSAQRMRDLLDQVAVEHRGVLLRELVQIDQERCLTSGRTVPAKNYHLQFPDHAAALDALMADKESADIQDAGTLASDHAARLPVSDIGTHQVIGSYELQELIGEGGMGVVYRAVHQELGRTVALKIVAIPMAEAVSRLQAEARTIAGLNHPNIVQIFETGEYQQRPYLVLELMPGGSLDDTLRQDLPSAKRAAEILLQITEAIAAAHEIGIIHRDLKPANVLMDADGNAKLADFGLARNLNLDSQTMSGALLGTPGFMSPEQTTGDEPHRAMDIYGLGAILYAALTGRPPFRGTNITDTLTMVRDREPVSVRALVPSVPVDLESVCLKCLQKNPSSRYASAAELADELRAFLSGRSVKARPPSRPEKLWRWCRRNPTVASLSAVLTLAVVLGISGVVWQWRRAEANAERFAQAAELAQAETQRAEEEAETTAAVNLLMQDVLGAAQASRLGRNATVRDAMDEAADRVDDVFADRHRVAAAVHQTLGETYRSLGEGERAIEQLRLALQYAKTAFGDTEEHTLAALDGLAGALRSLGEDTDLAEAASLRETVLQQRSASLGDTHPRTIVAMNNLATVYMDAGKDERAAELYKQALSLIGRHPDSDPRDATPTRFNLASILWDRGRLDEAEREVRAVIESLAAEVDDFEGVNVELLNAQNTLAGILHDQQQHDEAASLYRSVLAERQRLLGRDHPHTLSTHRRLTRLLVAIGQFEAALPLLQDCLELHNGKVGEAAGLTFSVRQSVATALVGLHRTAEAESFLRETLTILQQTRGEDHRYTLQARQALDEFLETAPTSTD